MPFFTPGLKCKSGQVRVRRKVSWERILLFLIIRYLKPRNPTITVLWITLQHGDLPYQVDNIEA